MQFPLTRLRRNRKAQWSRNLVTETSIAATDFIYPLFIQEGKKLNTPIGAMPGVSRVSIDLAVELAKKADNLGIPVIALFPSIDKKLKSNNAKEAANPKNLICRAIKEIKQKVPNIGIMADVALDPYTLHGHDGIVIGDEIDNDITNEALVKQALVLAESGCDIIAPSDMMDGRIFSIRYALEDNGFKNTQILSYAAKYASHFYSPFRDAVGSQQQGKNIDKKTYQMDFRNAKEALIEVELDIQEGADMVIIKPGMPYLDIIKTVTTNYDIPVIAYQVSGEYAMIKFAALGNALSYEDTMYESLMAFKRAGCRAIITYSALEMAQYLHKKQGNK